MNALYTDSLAMQRGYIILIAGAVLLISGIVISIFWAGSFAGTIIRENTILSGVSIRSAGSVNASTQVIDTSRPVSLAIHVERNNSTTGGEIPNNILRETVRNPNGVIMTSNEFTKQIFTTFKPDVTGKYTVTIYNLGDSRVSIGVLAGNLPFIGANNKVNFNSLSGIIVGIILTIAGIIVLIAGVVVLILDGRRIRPRTETTLPPSSSATTNTETETIVLARWIDRFIAWLIDFIIVSIGLGVIFAAISLPFWIAFPHWFETTNMNMGFRSLGGPWPPYLISSLVFMAYWSIVAGPSFLQYLNKLFQIQTSAGDIIQFESGNTSKFYMLSATGTWDELIKLQ